MILPIRNLYIDIFFRYIDKYVRFFQFSGFTRYLFLFTFTYTIRCHVNKMFLSSAFAYFKLLLKGDSFV